MINLEAVIIGCLGVSAEQSNNPKIKRALEVINVEVQQKIELSETIDKHNECFDELYVSMVKAEETRGILDEVFNCFAKLLEDMARPQN